ncbi:MAG: glycosyltransferase family A protein [Thermodesulfovibrionales bacterium]
MDNRKDKFDISVVITAHHEGRLAHHTMRSVSRARQYARDLGLETEVIIVLDRPDQATTYYFSAYEGPDILKLKADFGDPGLSRNFGVAHSSGRFISIVDADNLIAKNWLNDTCCYLDDTEREVVAHPEYQMLFENENLVFRQISSTDPAFSISNTIEYNYWDTVCVARKDIFLRHPYEETTGGPGFGFEDWHWNCQTLADGIEHHVVPNTIHFMRMKKNGSNFRYHVGTSRIVRPSRLFDPAIFSRELRAEQLRNM